MENKNPHRSSTILGLDIGSNSIGWILISKNPKSPAILDEGVRVFEAGVEGIIERGWDKSRGVQRREARLARRQLDRRARRRDKLYIVLAEAGLLPSLGEKEEQASAPRTRRQARVARSRRRHQAIKELDLALTEKWRNRLSAEGASPKEVELVAHRLPYLLRARGLYVKLEPFELGRALFHMGQKRGFLSTRKSLPRKDEDEGKIKKYISELGEKIVQTGCRTLGEYFARVDPYHERIRGRWTSRQMSEAEFQAVWNTQRRFQSGPLSAELEQRIKRVLFFQRPLKIRKEFIGKCEWEEGRRRAPWSLLISQRFRMVQQVNNMRKVNPDTGEIEPLSPEERLKLIESLELVESLTLTDAKKTIGLSRRWRFNFESGEETGVVGNKTAAKLSQIFGEQRWRDFSPQERDRIIDDIRSFEKEEPLARRAMRVWGLDQAAARRLAALKLEGGYAGLSRRAMEKLLPLMEGGLTYPEAAKQAYGGRPIPEPVQLLPPVIEALPELRNPTVSRTLTELRKIINAVIRAYGKPDIVRVEMARDLRKSRLQRKQSWNRARANEKKRQEAAKKVTKETGDPRPNRRTIEKWLLADECRWCCPYTGRGINVGDLFGPNPHFDIEHIIPFSRCLDNSFLNKTLCHVEENRNVKANRSPWEAYGSNPQRWKEIVQRVKRFTGDAAKEKLRRFNLREVNIDDFASQQLNDTRYSTKLAVRYLGLLFGQEARGRVQATRGGMTAFLRNEWGLNSILNDGPGKSREDHRHHAVDALVVALTDRSMVKLLSESAVRAAREGRRLFAPLAPPWPGFWDDAKQAVEAIIVSHRVSRRVKGPLHQETIYSPPKMTDGGQIRHHERKPVNKLSPGQVENIVDPSIKRIVKQALGGKPPKEAFADESDHPFLTARDGRRIPVHRVRIATGLSALTIGGQGRERHVVTDTNHHVEILEVADNRGRLTWDGRLVSLFEAARRHKEGEPIIQKDHGPGRRFVFSLSLRESVIMKTDDGTEECFIVNGISQAKNGRIELEFRRHADARPIAVLKKMGGRVRKTPKSLHKAEARKVVIDPRGRIRRAND